MNPQKNANATPKELLLDRLYAELKANPTGTDEFEAAFKYIQKLEPEEKDPELLELEKQRLKIQIVKDETEIKKETAHIKNLHKKDPFFERHADAIITAAAGIFGVALVVGAEQLGNQILNSKALKMPTMKF